MPVLVLLLCVAVSGCVATAAPLDDSRVRLASYELLYVQPQDVHRYVCSAASDTLQCEQVGIRLRCECRP